MEAEKYFLQLCLNILCVCMYNLYWSFNEFQACWCYRIILLFVFAHRSVHVTPMHNIRYCVPKLKMDIR